MQWQLILFAVIVAAFLILFFYLFVKWLQTVDTPITNENTVNRPIRRPAHPTYYPNLDDLYNEFEFSYIPQQYERSEISEESSIDEPDISIELPTPAQIRRQFRRIIILQDNVMDPEEAIEEIAAIVQPVDVQPEDEPAETAVRRDKKHQATEEFFQNLNEHNNDGQNVHDVTIRKCLTDRLLRVIELNGGAKKNYEFGGIKMSQDEWIFNRMQQVARDIQQRANGYFDGLVLRERMTQEEARLRIARVRLALNKISNGYQLMMRDTKMYKEDYVLVQVWDRINHKDNFANREQLQIALIDNLVDCTHKKAIIVNALGNLLQAFLGEPQPLGAATGIEAEWTTHCINGRVARILTSLVLLDADTKISQPERDEKEMANEAYAKAAKVLENELKSYKVSISTDRDIESLYNEWDDSKLSDVEKLAVANFEEHVKNKIRDTINSDYKDLFAQHKLDEIIEKAQAGI